MNNNTNSVSGTNSTLNSRIIQNVTSSSIYSIHGNGGSANYISITEVIERLAAVEKMLLIINPQIGLMEKYPALKAAYDEYQIVLKMVESGN